MVHYLPTGTITVPRPAQYRRRQTWDVGRGVGRGHPCSGRSWGEDRGKIVDTHLPYWRCEGGTRTGERELDTHLPEGRKIVDTHWGCDMELGMRHGTRERRRWRGGHGHPSSAQSRNGARTGRTGHPCSRDGDRTWTPMFRKADGTPMPSTEQNWGACKSGYDREGRRLWWDQARR